MENFHAFKCSNCGSNEFKQLSENGFRCEHCGTCVISDNSIKDAFMADINDKVKIKNRVHFIKAAFTEEEFYKRALTYLSMQKSAPSDVLDGEFGFIDYKYSFFVALDVEFSVLSVNPTFDTIKNKDGVVSFSISSNTETLFARENRLYIDLTDEKNFNQKFYNIVNCSAFLEKSLYEEDVNKTDMNFPSKEEIDEAIENTISNYKVDLLRDLDKSSIVIHTIKAISIYAVPEYCLQFTYKNAEYKLSSFAHKLDIVGTIPTDLSRVKAKERKLQLPLQILSSIVAICAIVFAYFNLTNRLLGWIKYNIFLIILTVLVFVASCVVNKLVVSRARKNLFNQKKLLLIEFIKEKVNCEVDDNDLSFIDNFIRWY